MGHLTFVHVPLAKAYHIAKNTVHLFSGKNFKVTWQRVWIQEEVKKNNKAIHSIYHRGGAKAVALISGLPHIMISGLPHMLCILHNSTCGRSCRGWNPAHTLLPKAMPYDMVLCPFSNKSTASISESPVLNSSLKAKNLLYHCPPIGCSYKLPHQVFQFHAPSTSFILFYFQTTPSRYHFKHTQNIRIPGCQGVPHIFFFGPHSVNYRKLIPVSLSVPLPHGCV